MLLMIFSGIIGGMLMKVLVINEALLYSKEELEKAIEQYNSRDRRYGGIKEDEENV